MEAEVPRLIWVTDRAATTHEFDELCRSCLRGGIDAILIREKDLSSSELGLLVVRAKAEGWTRDRIIVNSSIDIAIQYGVGLHLPERGMETALARRALGPTALIGRSVHSLQSLPETGGADYLLAGHIFPTPSKATSHPLGLAKLQVLVRSARVPVIGIGGIEPANADLVLSTGVHGIAVMSAIGQSDHPECTAMELSRRVKNAGSPLIQRPVEHLKIVVNGKRVTVEPGSTVLSFLTGKGLNDRLVVVECNGVIESRSSFAERELIEGDRLEIVHFVGGG